MTHLAVSEDQGLPLLNKNSIAIGFLLGACISSPPHVGTSRFRVPKSLNRSFKK